jgi:hypothetical protein
MAGEKREIAIYVAGSGGGEQKPAVLHVVADDDLKSTPKIETVSERIQRLQAEAKQLAKDHIRSLSAQMVNIERIAAEIAEGGDAYPPGVREVCRVLVEDIEARIQTIEAIVSRTL